MRSGRSHREITELCGESSKSLPIGSPAGGAASSELSEAPQPLLIKTRRPIISFPIPHPLCYDPNRPQLAGTTSRLTNRRITQLPAGRWAWARASPVYGGAKGL